MAPTNINLEPDLPIGSIATPEDIYFLVDNLQGAPISNAMTLETLQAAAGGTTNLSIGTIDPIANTIEILSSTGTPAVLEQASDLVPGLMSVEDWTKLAGLGAGPTINVDDYASVQLALDAIPVTGARVVFPQPEYLVHTLDIDQKNNVIIDLCGTVLKAPDAASTDTGNWGLRIRRCNRVLVQNGTIDGNRANRTPQDPTNPSYNLYIRGGSHVKIQQLHTINSVSDGVYIRAEDDFTRSTFPTDILLENVVADNNFRQGVSCITSNGVVMIGGALINTNGADPGAGWQVEPSEAGGAEPGNSNVTLIGVRIEGNSGFGAGSVAPKDFRGLHIAGCHFGQNGKGAIENGSPVTIIGNLFKAITSAVSGSVIRSNSTGQSGSTRIVANHFEDIDAFDATNPIAECVYSADQGRLVMTGNTAVNTPALASAWGDDSDISHNIVEGCVVPTAAISLRGARSKANYNQLSNCKENVIRVQLAEGETGQVIGNDIWDCNQVLQTSYGLIRIVEGAIDVFDNNLNRSDGQPTWRGIRIAGNNICRVQRNRIKNLDAAPIFDETAVAIVSENLIDDVLDTPTTAATATVEVVGSGVPATDEAAFAAAIATLEGLGGGLIRVTGDPTNNQFYTTGPHTYLSSISLEGTGQGVRFMMQDPSVYKMQWGNINLDSITRYSTSCAAGAQSFSSPGNVLSEGDWVVIWSENQLDVHPHNGFGTGQHGMELKQVHYFDSIGMRGYTDSAMVDAHGARAQYAVIPMIKNVRISNITFEWDGAGELSDFSQALRFETVHGLVIDDTVRFARNGPGAIWLGFVADGRVNCVIDGSDKFDGVYGIVAAGVNGLTLDAIVRGTRHGFTTASPYQVDEQIAVDSVQITPTNTLTAAAHGLTDNMHVSLTTTVALPGGLAPATDYWVVNKTDDTIQLALAPSGAPVEITDVGTGTHTIQRVGRWGTPQRIIDSGIYYGPTKVADGPALTPVVVWSPHAEGSDITFSGEIIMSSEVGNTGMVLRSRDTTITNAVIRSGRQTSVPLAKGIICKASGTRILNSLVSDLWFGVQVGTGNIPPVEDTIVDGVTFCRVAFPPVYLFAAASATISNVTPVDCGYTSGSSPFYRKSLVYVRQQSTDVTIINCGLRKADNDYSIVCQVDPSELTIVGNTLTGYGAGDGGLGRSMTVSNVDVGNDELDMSGTHGWDTNDLVRVSTTGTLPSGIAPATDYRVIDTGAATVQLSLTIDGPPIPIADAGSGTHTLTDSAAVILTPTGSNWVD